MTIRISSAQRRVKLAHRHHLLPAERSDDLATLADDVVAFHSSDPVTVYLSALARMAHPSIAAVEQALYADRSLIRHHGVRRTLWVATPEVMRMIHGAATRALVGPETRRVSGWLLASGIVDPAAWLEDAYGQVRTALHELGPCTARQLGEHAPALRHQLVVGAGTRNAVRSATHTRLLLLLGFRGEILRARPTGRWINGAYRYAFADDWLSGGLGDLDEGPAAAGLLERWLRRFGPATTTDVRWWTGWTVATTTRALLDVSAVAVELDTGPGWMVADDLDQPAGEFEPWVAVLPSLDPTVMGWKERGWYLPATAADAFDRRGNAGPTLWVDGRVVGAWAQLPSGALVSEYFEDLPRDRRRQLDQRLAEVGEWVGDTRFTVRFPGLVDALLRGVTDG